MKMNGLADGNVSVSYLREEKECVLYYCCLESTTTLYHLLLVWYSFKAEY